MKKYLTPKQVAELLQCDVSKVYKNRKKLGSFYPAGIRIVRFDQEVLREPLEGKRQVALSVSARGLVLQQGGLQNRGWQRQPGSCEKELSQAQETAATVMAFSEMANSYLDLAKGRFVEKTYKYKIYVYRCFIEHAGRPDNHTGHRGLPAD